MPRPTWRAAVIVAVLCAPCCPSRACAGLFVTPIGGVPFQDWAIGNYVDLDPGPGTLDWHGGHYTYNGHDALDIGLANFAAMDAGVSVHAAAGGTVVSVNDGEYDRWSGLNPNPGFVGNYIWIDHGDGIVTKYYHLMKNSTTVHVGDTVTAGQQIAQVGSSGNSSGPHLHFAVYEDGNVVETYLDPDRWWQEPVPYTGSVPGSLDHGITNYAPDTEQLSNRPTDYNVFRQVDGSGQVVYLWANLFGIHNFSNIDAYFFRPNGTQYAHFHWLASEIHSGWWIAAIVLPNVPDLGQWRAELYHDGGPIVEETFTVVLVPEPTGIAIAAAGLAGLVVTTWCRRRWEVVVGGQWLVVRDEEIGRRSACDWPLTPGP